MELTRSQELRVLARLEEEDLHRFEFNSRENVESIETTKRNLERYTRELALYQSD